MKNKPSIPAGLACLLLLLAFPSCKSIKYIPENLKFNTKRHSHIRTMRLHMLFIDRVNGRKLKYSRMKRVYDVKTYPGMKTVDVIYSGGSGPTAQKTGKKLAPGTYRYWVYKQQKKRIRFRALPGKAHFIQYIAHPGKPMSVWVGSHDYISHLRKKPVYKRNLDKNRTMRVSRTVKGSLKYVKKRFLNELMLQEYLEEIIGGWSIRLMFKEKGNMITVNRPGIGERQLDNRVTGYYKFSSAGGRRTRITMHVRKNVHTQYPGFMKQVFSRFEPAYRVKRVK